MTTSLLAFCFPLALELGGCSRVAPLDAEGVVGVPAGWRGFEVERVVRRGVTDEVSFFVHDAERPLLPCLLPAVLGW